MRRQAAKHRKKRSRAEKHPRLWPILALAVAASLAGALLTTWVAAEHRDRTRRMVEHDSLRLHAIDSARAAGREGATGQPGLAADGGRR
jgi:type II secretory pathway pseudopilin PulG